MSAPAREVRNEIIYQGRKLAVDDDWLDDLRLRIDDLCAIAGEYLEPDQVDQLREACYFATEAHAGVYRKSGEPYIFHPLAVARILANVRFDHETLQGALLHDVIEDTPYSKEQIGVHFGPEVANLVDGVSKLTQIQFNSKLEAQAENFRKMFLAMAKDLRVIMIKLADRLHNMRTLGAMRPESRRRIARETLEIYAPIAGRLGMNHLRQELEDLGLSHLHPLRFQILQDAVRKMSGNRREIVGQLEARIQSRLEDEGITARVMGRSKHLWGIYQKMRHKRLPFKEVYDVYAVRIIVENADTCYRVLGAMHSLYKPIMGRFKDYIAIPKANGYQSLHTVLFGPNGVPIEAQIRTEEMHVMAEVGVAAHWRYKSGSDGQGSHAQQRAREWLRKLLDMQRRAGNPVEFLESVKVDLFPDEVYVFTPRGEIIELPRGATAVDFAYAIHSDVGNTCVGAKVDRRLAPLRTPLSTGQTVEVIITPTARPNPAWLNFVVTAKARASIRHYLKHLQREEAILLGKRLLEKALIGHTGGLGELPTEHLRSLVQEFNLSSFDDLLADIGLGNRVAALIAKRLMPEDGTDETTSPDASTQPLLIKGTEGTVVSFGKCCRPLPGDAIIGYLNTGRGIVVHRDHCKNIAGYRKNPDKWIEVEWEPHVNADFGAELRLDVVNRRGVLATIAAAISATDSNIETINTSERDGNTTTVHLLLNVRDRAHLARVIRQLRTLPEALKLVRRG
ncbi:MAG: bifunctional GTP diphosphokinase/guanosine-3',5'-bis pyrophosphate 3'-pyrophosphohydrolase [Candidatus Competibacteraceae bacterium]|uniref:guanosine-3',5'-bis(diphosphate) 3'-diphosphatase n=1 Tax=Candidatus Contendobacter odensis Run_B_J11 TaxID=1400861 RepID=A0A7U7J2V4_9GAMM|nr:bifunctional GTP diphosphokinase/guanosine-3',5'-bis pyrophosphate 3'-pyrophosphohydrolase [Candidatus Contendobacter odensis]MBK8536126.1 bifunctional GTP diphosphokinase/guanosine-3',5'-bis pyrophosphate 3'-pyrophosphohydrolase [Candidatus Competibacteraceae bacterium]MBK8754862.1 bifunctional GTP diphosphokinase/guanosine-3',5'-bis pyrophosphate 3'-pyrophosphohydrolase [Candidatus Competibacteraceae bacterium]CDH43887.1 bifunctional: (p)ppGpp synthetase II; guanosine-3',5'-bis pyrophosphat